MRSYILNFCLLLITSTTLLFSQAIRETRAVWVTTNYKLDWPPNTTDEEKQKNSLQEIFQNLSEKKFNTVYFQVRSNGTVMYNSDIEPYSPYIAGNVGEKPSYDPLQYAIQLGRKYNLEVHAWVNMMRCFSGSDNSIMEHPKHIRNAHPDWTVKVRDNNDRISYWMNPGYFRSQDYLVEILLEITNKYDVDGIHLDFFRYPDKNFADGKYFGNYGLNVSLEDWRRNNLTIILRKFKEKLNPKNPFLKVGAAPIGIRKNLKGAIGWEGYSSVFQDTEGWLKEGLVDYLTPQIYWDFEKNPKFDVLAKDWVKKSYNKNIVLGLAAYKKDVKPQLSKMINFSREIGAAGISFFRYENIASISNSYFTDIAFPTNMQWKTKGNHLESKEINCNYKTISNDEVMMEWEDINKVDMLKSRNYALVNDSKPIKLLSLNKTKIKLKFGKPSKLLYKYQICKLDRLWNYSSVSKSLNLFVPYLAELKISSQIHINPVLYKLNENSALLSVTSFSDQTAVLDIITIENLKKQRHTTLKTGLNIIPIKEKMKIVKTIRITFNESGRREELNLF